MFLRLNEFVPDVVVLGAGITRNSAHMLLKSRLLFRTGARLSANSVSVSELSGCDAFQSRYSLALLKSSEIFYFVKMY